MAASYSVAVAMLVVALTIGGLVLCIPRWLAPTARRSDDNPAYEYGGRTAHKTWGQLRVRYAVLALLFVAFDMEMVYMFPWAGSSWVAMPQRCSSPDLRVA